MRPYVICGAALTALPLAIGKPESFYERIATEHHLAVEKRSFMEVPLSFKLSRRQDGDGESGTACEKGSWKASTNAYTKPSKNTRNMGVKVSGAGKQEITKGRVAIWETTLGDSLAFQDIADIGVSFGYIFQESLIDASFEQFNSNGNETGEVGFTAHLWCEKGNSLPISQKF